MWFYCNFVLLFGVSIVYGASMFPKSPESISGVTDNLLLLAGRNTEYLLHWQLYQVCVMRFIHL